MTQDTNTASGAAEPNLHTIQAKLIAAQNCHPNAVQILIGEALNAIDTVARAALASTPEQPVAGPANALPAAHVDNAPFGFTEREKGAWSVGYEEGASHGQAPANPAPSAAAALPEGWVPLVITHEGQYPEDIAYGPQIMMDRLGKWLGKYFAQAAQAAESVTEPARVEDGDIDAVALARYKVVPAHESMIHRFAVVAGDGNQQLYLGREVECENMARKFAGAFLDGAFYQVNITPPTQAADSVQEDAAQRKSHAD